MAKLILVCDRCGKKMTEKSDIELVFMGMDAWKAAVRARGCEPRGIYPCENYATCGGEMEALEGKKKIIVERKAE